MEKNDRLNQELTRKNIIELRKKHGYSQKKLSELMGVSRSYYNSLETGYLKITELYVQTIADFYHVPFNSIAVFSRGYDEGFQQGIAVRTKLEKSEFDSMSMKIYQLGKELKTGEKYVSTLYPALKAMGYTIEVVDITQCNPVKIPPEILDSIPDGKIFVLKKDNKKICYLSPKEFYSYEKHLTSAIKGYIQELTESSDKANLNRSYSLKSRPRVMKFSRYNDPVVKALGGELHKSPKGKPILCGPSPDERYSIKHQIEELKSALGEHSEMLGSNEDEKNQ